MAFQGSLKELPLPDIIQLVSVSGKTGKFSLTNGRSSGEIHLLDGRIVHALAGELEGEEAVYEMAIWTDGNFVFSPTEGAEKTTVRKSNTNLLMEAARRIDEWKVLSKRIPSIRLVPVFTSEATKTSVSLAPQEWKVISKIDERRSIEELAIAIDTSPFEACKLLYGLITSELIVLKEDLSQLPTDRLGELNDEQLNGLVAAVLDIARQKLQGRQAELDEVDRHARLAEAVLIAGRPADAVLDLVRALEKIVSTTGGPNQAKELMTEVQSLLSAP
ncbi:MAG: DUF4388 domain-containing protein [Acidobacteriota bacterium]